MLYTIMFSPTGGTSKAARKLSLAWEKDKKEIDLFHKGFERRLPELCEEDVCIVAAPVYSGRIPSIAAERIAMLKGNGARAVVMAVYGNCKLGDAMVEMEDILSSCGFNITAGIEAVAEHSLIREFASGRPDTTDAENLLKFGKEIQEKIAAGNTERPRFPGNRPYKERKEGLHPFVLSGCIDCSICARECPANAISWSGNWVADPKKCISCMHCIRFCPKSYRILPEDKLKAIKERLEPIASVRKEDKLYI